MNRASFSNRAEDVQEQISRLRSQVDQLVQDRVNPALSSMADRASHAAHAARDSAREKTEAMSDRVRDRPVAAMLIAIGLGFILGRALR